MRSTRRLREVEGKMNSYMSCGGRVCKTCGGFIPEPGKAYGYVGPVCQCTRGMSDGFDKVDRALELVVIDWLQWSDEFNENRAANALELIKKRKAAYAKLQAQLKLATDALEDIKSGGYERAKIFGPGLLCCPACSSAETADKYLQAIEKLK